MDQRNVGVLLVNLGTPEAPTPAAVRRYLREFLSDRRVIEVPRPIWWLVLRAFILPFRPRKSAEAYAAIWDHERGESPLRTATRALAEALPRRGALADSRLRFDWAMRYGEPSIARGLDALASEGCDRILLWPLYPQYSASTTATVVDEAGRALADRRAQPALRIVPPYYDDPSYVRALGDSIRRELAALDWRADFLLASFHGLPERYVARGDPYADQCRTTAEALRRELGLAEDEFGIAFQSRFGPSRWIGPATDRVLAELPDRGLRRVAVVSPGFAADCVETLEELGIRGRETFLGAGGERFALLPCLNASPEALEMAEKLLLRELAGWLGK